jgi:hypothetical protein
MTKLRDFLRDERMRRQGADQEPMIMMRVLVEPVLSPDGDRISGGRQLETGVSAVIPGRGGGRIWQRDNESIEAFKARVEAVAGLNS